MDPDPDPEKKIYVKDADADGYHDASAGEQESETQPDGWILKTSSAGEDCDDTKPEFDEVCPEKVAELNPPRTLVKGSQQQPTPGTQSRHVPKDTDTYAKRRVERNIDKTFKKQAFNNCTTSSLGFIGQWVFNNGLTESKVLLEVWKVRQNGTEIGKLLRSGQTPAQNRAIIESLYNTKSFTSFKAAIDDGHVVMTDVFVRDVQEPSLTNPNVLETIRITHAVAVVGYDENNNMIFYDPAKGNFQVAPAGNLNQSYAIVLRSTK